ncbi:hypothetical protein HPB49_017340 [Dermacentor silvarum]|uniref:Uncharacterized protein n=1 Tax=Dermacentor silvarum TaxID=543639 RepID=A0ACB8DKK7_DERSI|nr:hypothetical protein HPB49_017340 [Dermacentor silvarum]
MAQSRPIKMVVVGDGMVGKTCLLVAFTTGAFPGTDYEPTVPEADKCQGVCVATRGGLSHSTWHMTGSQLRQLRRSLVVDGVTANLTLWDTAGQEGLREAEAAFLPWVTARVRARIWKLVSGESSSVFFSSASLQSDVFLLCFSISSEASYNNILTKWQPELKHHCPTTPYVLVASQRSLGRQCNFGSCLRHFIYAASLYA